VFVVVIVVLPVPLNCLHNMLRQ